MGGYGDLGSDCGPSNRNADGRMQAHLSFLMQASQKGTSGRVEPAHIYGSGVIRQLAASLSIAAAKSTRGLGIRSPLKVPFARRRIGS